MLYKLVKLICLFKCPSVCHSNVIWNRFLFRYDTHSMPTASAYFPNVVIKYSDKSQSRKGLFWLTDKDTIHHSREVAVAEAWENYLHCLHSQKAKSGELAFTLQFAFYEIKNSSISNSFYPQLMGLPKVITLINKILHSNTQRSMC